MINYHIATKNDIELFMQSRLEMLKVVNNLSTDYQFSPDFIDKSRAYFENGNQTTVLAFAGETVIGCATMCYIKMLPTFDHPTGHCTVNADLRILKSVWFLQSNTRDT